MIPFETLLQFFVHGIIRRHQGGMDSSEFSNLEKGFKEGVETLEWLLSGRDTIVFNVLMETGNKFLADGNVEIALAFYREASYLFPHVAACCWRETSCHLHLKFFDQAKKACKEAITRRDPDDVHHSLEIIDEFVKNERLQEAHDLYISLHERFPRRYDILEKVKELKELLQKAKEDEAKTEYKTERHASKDSNEIKKKTGKNVGQSTKKVVKKSKKQLIREEMRRQMEIKNEIEKASKEQDVKLKKQEELKARKRKEKEEKEEKLRKEAEEEARKRKQEEEHKKKLMKQKSDEIKKKQANEHVRKKSPRRGKVIDTQTTQSKNKVSLNDMSNAFDQILQSGSRVRRVCPTCNTPRAFSYSRRFCHLCNSEFVIWVKKIDTTNWIQQRKPPKGVVGRYQLCKHFLIAQKCAKVPCTFAHSQDEMDVWKLCSVTTNEDSEEHKTSFPSSRERSRSCMTLNGDESGNGRLSRTDSISSLSSLQSFPNAFDVSVENQKKHQKVISQKELNIENRSENENKTKATSKSAKTDSHVFDNISSVMEQEKLRCTFCDVRFLSMPQLKCHYSDTQHKVNVVKRVRLLNTKSTMKSRFPDKKFRLPPDGVYMGRYKLCHRFEKGYCYLQKQCTFAHGNEERAYWIELYQRQVEYLTQLEKKQLVTEGFGEKVRRRMQHEDFVLKRNLPGVTVNCNSPLQKQLYEPGDHEWIIEVRIQTKFGLLLSEVSFLLETHLDKFKFCRSDQEEDHSLNKQSIRFFEDHFVEDSFKQESAVQFKVKFFSDVFGDFKQKMVFDFGRDMVLVRALNVSILSKDICDSKEKSTSRTTHCRILEWSLGDMELVECKDLTPLYSDGVSSEQYSIPNHLRNPSEVVEFTRENYCNLWHDILFIEEKHIQGEVWRYDMQNGIMKIVNCFQSTDADEMVFAQQGEFFGEIYLSDYLVMDEVAGHLINRSVMSVIVRLRIKNAQSKRVYECSIKLKKPGSVIVKLNAALLKDYSYVFRKDQEINIDVKFRYNRVPMCEMHQAIDMCKQKTEVLLPNLKNVSYKFEKSIPDWFMGDKKPNTNQHEAIAMILDPNPTPPILVIGPFGTGKTFTLNLACVSILSQSPRNKVLICTHSNSAADIHLEHLNAKIENNPLFNQLRPLRVLNLFRKVMTVPKVLRKYCLVEESTNIIMEPLWEEIHDHNVIITTLSSARMLWKFYHDGKLRFTHILIDEAAQALEPECVIPLAMADKETKIVLAGDHKQMGPSVYSKSLWAEDFGPKRSLLERLFTYYKQYNKQTLDQLASSLDHNSSLCQTPYVVMLTENYRCHAKILEFPSDCFYGGKLLAKGDQSTHDLVPVLSFYAAQGIDNRDEGSLAYYNDGEVVEVVKRVEELIQLWPNEWSKSIGVLTPYRDQVKRIRDSLRKKDLRYVDVETVENVQGKEFKALFISTVRTMWTCSQIEGRNLDDPSELDFGFLSDPRFLNTAVTRAQSLLAVVGDPMSLCSVGACRNLWKDYLQRCSDNNGLYGCTLKTVMGFCLRSHQLDPSAHEFVPVTNKQDKKDEMPTDTSFSGNSKVSSEEYDTGIKNASNTELSNGSVSIKCDPPSTSANSNIQPSPLPAVNGQLVDGGEEMQVDGESELAVSNQDNCDDNATGEDENDTKTDQSATDNFFRRHDVDDFDNIIEELIKACKETKKMDEGNQKARNEHFPPLNHVSQAAVIPHRSNVNTHRTFSAGLKDGRIELGFHVKESEFLFRLTGGKSSFKEKGDKESCHDIETFSQEKLLELLKGNSNLFTKCSLRKDPLSRQQKYYGELPTPDSPDIHLPGRVRGVLEDDVVVVELQQITRARDEKQQDQVIILGCIKGILRRLVNLGERQFVCTVDQANPSVMIPINKNSPKFVNLTKTDEKIIPIYTFKDERGSRAKKLSKKHYEEALAGERVFIVKYLKWRLDCPYPLGLAVHHIPHGKDFETGMEILYQEHNVRRKFSPELCAHVAKDFSKNWQIPLCEKSRPAYRDNVFTIDPPESLDLDDAISIQALGNGNFDLHVHIADVSYFVLPNTPLDEEASLRGTSYYPPKPHETVPMLPRELSEDCCSLLEGRDRLAVTMSVEVKPDGTIVGDTRIARSIVCSSSRLTYLEAQRILDESSQTDSVINGEARQIPVEEAIGVVHHIAQGRRKVRLGFKRSLYERKRDDCDEDIDNEREAHQMIEEIMVMANHLVAKYLLKKFPKSTPLCVQPPPKTRRVVEWRRRFQKFINCSLGLEWLKDADNKQEETIKLKVPVKTWSNIIDQVRKNSNFRELVKLICDLDLFPQLAVANVHQQRLQQRGQYRCSGETFEGLRYPWPPNEREPSVRRQFVYANHVSADVLAEDINSTTNSGTQATDGIPSSSSTWSDEPSSFLTASEDRADETSSVSTDGASLVSEGVQCSANVSNQENLDQILYGHSSLCLDAYCHFTSPIRRYIDIIVHRLLVASIENRTSILDPDDITTICDRCTFFARNSRRFDKSAKKLQLALSLQNSFRFVSAFLEDIVPDALKLYFGTGKFEFLRDKSVRIAQLGPDKDPEAVDDGIRLRWTFRFLRLDKEGHAQPRLHTSDNEISHDQTGDEETSDDDFDYTVSGEQWKEVLDAVKNRNEDQLKSRLYEVDGDIQKQEKPESPVKISPVKRPKDHKPNEFLKVTRSFKPYDRVKVQISSQMSRGVLSPAIQLFQLTDTIHACVEHRGFPTICFAKTPYKRPTNTEISNVTEYVQLWKPVLMMEIATSAVREDDVITLSNLGVSLTRDTKGLVTMEFSLSHAYCKDHLLHPLDLNLMCVRVKDPGGSGKDTGFWVGHFQISEELRKKEDARKRLEEFDGNASTQTEKDTQPIEVFEIQETKKTENSACSQDDHDAWPYFHSNPSAPVPKVENAMINHETNAKSKTNEDQRYLPILARLIHSSTPIPESIVAQRYFYVTVELIMLSIPDRRRLGALVESAVASELVQDICIGKDLDRDIIDEEVPRNLSLSNVHHNLNNLFHPLNKYQQQAVQEALTKSFTLIQGPPGTGKTVTGVHIAYWFAQLNKTRTLAVEADGEECNGSMVFYCGPSNKSVDVVARYLMKIPGLKILRMYGQEIERKVFPVPDKITLFRSKRVAVQLKADEDLKDVSLHHVIRSAKCPFAEQLKKFDKLFQEYIRGDSKTRREAIKEFIKEYMRGDSNVLRGEIEEFNEENIWGDYNDLREVIEEFNKVKSNAEKWAITQTGVNVILATCTTAYSPRTLGPCQGFVGQCIIDECGMCIEAETLCAMLGSKAKQVVLIGDHKQLQPIIQCDEAKDLGLGISMFERLSERAHMLKIQYRMHEELCQFPSEFFYDGQLQTADEVRNRTPDNVTWPTGERYPFVFHHVEGIEESLVVTTDKGNENSKKNKKEIAKVINVARRLSNKGIKCENIVVLSPYRAQCFEITEQLKQHGLNNISVMSVVAAQGSEKDYVILSLVRSLPRREIERNPSRTWLNDHLGFITDEHQINVALTRAKRGLCIVGNANLIGVSSKWKALLEHYKNKDCLVDA